MGSSQDGPEQGGTGSIGGDWRRCGGGDGDGDGDGDERPKNPRGKIDNRDASSGTPRALAGGGWFAADGQAKEGDGKLEVRDVNSSSESAAGSERWRMKTERRRAGAGAGGEDRGEDSSGGGRSGGCGGGGKGYCGALPPNERQKQSLSLMLAYESGKTSDLVQCVIVRDVSGVRHLVHSFNCVRWLTALFQTTHGSIREL